MGILDRLTKGYKKGDEASETKRDDSALPRGIGISKGSEILTAWRMEEISRFEPSALPDPHKPIPSESSESFVSSHWPDEASREAEARLERKGIKVPWQYGDKFGEDFKTIGLRAGGVGAVFFVESERFGQKELYAAKTLQKFLHNEYLSQPSWWQKKVADDFLEEALPWLEMGQHAHIVPVHLLKNIIHPQTKRNIPFVFSEFMEKGDLRQCIIEKGRFSLEETLILGIQICDVLIHAYQYGLSAHKDLKPDNIMVYGDGIYRVTDFSAGIMGTPGYMAPEQIRLSLKMGEQGIDHRADQFAIGLIIHDVIKGQDLREEQRKRVIQIRNDPGTFVRQGLKGNMLDKVPSPLGDIIARCLQPRPEDRFESISILREELLKAYGIHYRSPEVEVDDSGIWWFDRGMAFYELGRYVAAESSNQEALRRYSAIPGTEIDQARCLTNLGTVYNYTGQFEKAESHYQEALKRYSAIPGTEINQASCLLGLGNVYDSTSQFEKADTHYKDALKRFEAIPGTEISQARCLMNLGNVYTSTGQFKEGESHHQEALKWFSAIPGTEIDQARCLMNLGTVYNNTGQFEKAESHYHEALKRYSAIPGTEIDQASCLTNLGTVYNDTGQFEKAESHHQEALKRYSAIPGTEIEQAICLMNLGNVYNNTGQFEKAESHYQEALRRFSAIPGTEIYQARCLANLGILYSRIQKYEMAKEVVRRCLNICDQYPLGTEQIRKVCLEILGKLP